jgi:tetratricopeptide (TPR) repeat protein
MFRDMRHRYGVAHCRLLIGEAYCKEGRMEDAALLLEDALETFQNCGDPWISAVTTEVLAVTQLSQGQTADAIGLLEKAYRNFDQLGDQESCHRVRDKLDSSGNRWRRLSRLGERLDHNIASGALAM